MTGRDKMHRLSPEDKRACTEERIQSGVHQIRLTFVVFIFLYGLFAILDHLLVGDYLSTFLFIRFGIVIPLMIVFLVLTFHPAFHKFAQPFMVLCFVTGGTGIAYMLILYPENFSYYGGMFMVILSGYFLIKLDTPHSLFGGLATLIFYVAGYAWQHGTLSMELWMVAIFFLGANIIGALGNYQMDRIGQANFLHKREIHRQNEQLQNRVREQRTELLQIEKAIDSTSDAVVIFNPQGVATYCNAAYKLLIRPFSLPDTRVPHLFEDILANVLTGESWKGERTVLDDMGVMKVLLIQADAVHEENGNIAGIVTTCRDITEHKQAGMAIASSNKLLQTIINTAPMRIFYKNRELRYMGCNNAFAKDAGVSSPEAIIGKDDYQLAWKDQAELYRSDDLAVLESGIPRLSYDEPQTTPEGKQIWLSTSKVPLLNDSNEIIGVLGMYEDISERKKAETDKTRLLLRQRAILDNLPMMAWLKDTDSRLEMINQPYASACGRTLEACIGKTDLDLFPEEMAKGYMVDDLEVCRTGRKKQNEEKIVSPDGIKWHLTYKTPIYNEHGVVVGTTGIAQDISERKQAEKLLKDIIAKNPMSIQILDRDGITIEANPAYKSLFGAVPPSGYSLFRDPQLLQMGIGEIFDQLRNGATVSFPDTHFNAHDSVPEFPDAPVWVRALGFPLDDSSGKPEKFVLMHENITERRQAEQMLRESEEHLSSIFRSAPIGIGSVINRELKSVNSRLCEMTGYDEEELVGQNSRFLYPTLEDFEFVGREKYAQIRDHGTGTVETHWRRKDGTIIEILLSSTPVDMRDHAKGVTFTALDITERKLAEKERERLQMQLTQAQKMEAVGQLAGGVAHDFNNMLGVIIGYSELILEQGDSSQKFHAEMGEIQKAARRSADLTRQLLTFARKQTVAPKVLDLNQTVEGMLNMLRRLIGENINLIWMPRNGLWPINMDPSQIDQILANLCVNARDAITDFGKITVETENTPLSEEYCDTHAGLTPGEYVRITVSDNGNGMDQKTLAHIFEPFFTTKGVGEGTGLGLATVYGAVKQNNGFINAASEPGRGSTFTIYIPRYRENVLPVARTVAGEFIPSSTGTILLVEDEPMILNMTTQMLVRQGYRVLGASSPLEAIRLAQENVGSIDLLMTDVIMPEMNGRDLAQHLITISPDIKHLFMSGYTASVIEPHGVLGEGMYFIQKPFNTKDLAAAVRVALES